MRNLRTLAFTLIELLVVISIIGILAALAIPAVAGALVKGQLTGTLNNARQLQLATFNLNLENEAAGAASAWPGTNATPAVTFKVWRDSLTNILSASDIRKMFAAPRVTVPTTIAAITTASNTAFNVYQVGNVEDSGVVFLTTRNFNAKTPLTPPTVNATPYGDKGVVVMRKGGDGQVYQIRFVTNTNSTGIDATTQPDLVN
ncbi:MAG: prepilin-type N-terminal cleavage/methylation domain-containing protein [Terrimicrobiaceae bacterium]